MQKNVLIRLLNSLDKSERKEFRKFLCSPYFNQRQDVLRLFDAYLDISPFIIPKIEKEKLFKYIYPKESFKDAKLRHLLSYLTALIKDYYAQSAFKANELEQKIQLTEQLKQKGLARIFDREWSNAEQLNQKQAFRSATFYYHQYQLHLQKSEFLDQQRREGDLNIQYALNAFNAYYIVSVLKQSCEVLNHQKISERANSSPQLEQVLEQIEEGDLTQIPAIAIYYYSLMTLKNPKVEAHYQQLKTLISNHASLFPVAEWRDIYKIAINYCIKKLNSGEQEYIREAFELYRSGLYKGLLFENGMLSLFTYKNILNLGVDLKEFDWVEHYLTEYKTFLKPEDRENNYRYCEAVFYFNKPDYNRVLGLIQQVNFKNKLHQLDARRMLLRIYYEQNEINALESLLDSFQVYIRRQKDIGYHMAHYQNLITFVRKLLKQNLRDRSIRQKLKTEVESSPALAERRWLLGLLE